MDSLGQYGPIIISPGQQVTGTFSLNRMTSLNRRSRPCKPDQDHSYNTCLRNYAATATGCDIDIINNSFNCTNDQLKMLYSLFVEIKRTTRKSIYKLTGCAPKCTVNQYDFQLLADEKATWKREWISSFFLSSETAIYYDSVESYSYEIQVRM